jgi:hypothetical protein
MLQTSLYTKEVIRLRSRRYIRSALIGIVLILSLLYIVFQTRDWISRPELTVTSPLNGATIPQTAVVVSGIVTPGVQLTINGIEAYSNETGLYRTELLLPVGVHTLEVVARNKFGRKYSVVRQFVVTRSQE